MECISNPRQTRSEKYNAKMDKKNLWMIWFFLLASCVYEIHGRGVNGGMNCAVCTVVMGITTQVAEIHEESLLNATHRVCGYLPSWMKSDCHGFFEELKPYFHDLEYVTPDLICLMYGSCKIDEGEQMCHLFPIIPDKKKIIKTLRRLKYRKHGQPRIELCDLPLIKEICDILNNSYANMYPLEDDDGDGHSLLNSGRGSDWKGKDCNDFDSSVYPGKKPTNDDRYADSNCNGIYGVDEVTDQAWEDMLCKNSDQRGIIYIGDSVGAHFHMPQVWINPLGFTPPEADGMSAIMDELDWPQLGFATGFMNTTAPILIKGYTDSVYLRLRERNRCNHRDYQNIAQNGASSYEGISHVNAINKNQTADHPAIVFYAMVGNDVCNNYKPEDTVSHMTPPQSFKENVLKTLSILDNILPSNSHVILVGLVNADFIYPAMSELIHPIGKLHGNIRYKDMYSWFNCLQIGPCTGWLNSNATLRNLTSQRAIQFSQILEEIAASARYNHYAVHFINNPINTVARKHEALIPKLLEAVDSLHPNQMAQPLLAEEIWQNLLKDLPPEVLGPVNRNNNRIRELFGDQGGH